MILEDILRRIEAENVTCPGKHTLHPGVSESELDAWHTERPGLRLPDGLMALLRWSNGMGLYQDWHDGEPIYDEGAYRFFRLDEIKPADEAMYGESFADSRLLKSWWVFCVGPDSSVYFGFDTDTFYFWKLKPIVPEESKDLGPGIEQVFELVLG